MRFENHIMLKDEVFETEVDLYGYDTAESRQQ